MRGASLVAADGRAEEASMSPSLALFNHIDNCPQCNHVALDLCAEGKRLRDAVNEHYAKLVPAMPKRAPSEGERS